MNTSEVNYCKPFCSVASVLRRLQALFPSQMGALLLAIFQLFEEVPAAVAAAIQERGALLFDRVEVVGGRFVAAYVLGERDRLQVAAPCVFGVAQTRVTSLWEEATFLMVEKEWEKDGSYDDGAGEW